MNRESFEDEIRKSEQTLYRVSKTILNEEADCEDAVQEAILKAYEKLDTLREDAYFKTWMIRILINECYKIGRSKKGIASYDDSWNHSFCSRKGKPVCFPRNEHSCIQGFSGRGTAGSRGRKWSGHGRNTDRTDSGEELGKEDLLGMVGELINNQ